MLLNAAKSTHFLDVYKILPWSFVHLSLFSFYDKISISKLRLLLFYIFQLDDYANNPEVHKQNRFIANKMIEYLQKHIGIGQIHAQRPNSNEPVWIYAITDANKPELSIVE